MPIENQWCLANLGLTSLVKEATDMKDMVPFASIEMEVFHPYTH